MIRNHQNIFIVGLPGSGKTTLGKILAKDLLWDFEDSDQVIETMEGTTIKNIFETHGEKYFRKAEYNYLKNFSSNRIVVATGGGMPCQAENISLLRQKGTMIYLKCPVSVIINRLSSGDKIRRPMIKAENAKDLVNFYEKLIKERESFYQQADLIIDCQQNTEIVVKTIKQMLF
jgi:shikimate kinase